jgi:GcrA cell cycle regulator
MALVRRAARLHRRGLQAPEIAARLLVSLQTAQQLIEQATRGEPVPPPADAAEAEAEPAAPPSAPTPAERGCVYIDGDGPFADRDPFCGKPAMRGMPYCAEHAARCYRAARRAAALRELAAAE